MLRRILVLVVVLAGCSDDANNRRLADAPPVPDVLVPDAPDDAPITPPMDLELAVTKTGNGTGTVTSAPAGIACGASCTAAYAENTVVTLTAEPDASSLFDGWGGACSGTSPVCEVTLAAATQVTAAFKLKTYTVTVTKAGAGAGTVTGSGIDCGSTCEMIVDHGTTISLTATPVALNTFVGWGGACTGNGTCDLTITANTTINAGFALDELSLIVTRGGNGDGTVVSTPTGITCPGTCDFVFNANEMVTLTASPAASSTFTGWTGACTADPCIVTMDAAKAVTATFTLKKYALDITKTGSTGLGVVTSAPSGITCGTDCTEQYDHGTTITLSQMAMTGSTFAGWSGGCTGIGACTVTLNAASTVNARFTLNSYPLTTTVTGSGSITSNPIGIACPGDCAQNYNHGVIVGLTATADPGWTFMSWGGACTGNGACDVTMDQAKLVTATFTINQYNLDVTLAGMGSVTAPQITCPGDCMGTYDYNTVVSLTAAESVPGYAFTGWTNAPGCTTALMCNVTMDQARTVTATFTLKSYNLDVTLAGMGSVTASQIACPGDCTGTYTHGTVVALTAVESVAGYAFSGWTNAPGCTTALMCNVTMDQARTVTATFTLKSYNLDVTLAGMGSVTASQIACPGDCTGTYTHGTVVALTAVESVPGYTFAGWTNAPGCTTALMCNVTMDQARTVTATFTLNSYNLDVTIAGMGSVTASQIACPGDCTGTYTHGTVVALTAAESVAGYTFAGWTNAPGCTTATTCNVTMTAARTVTATFTLNSYNLDVTIAGMGSVTASQIACPGDCTGTYTHGTVVALTAAESVAGYTFAGWTNTPGCTTATTCNVTMTAARTVTAMFTLNSYNLDVTIAGMGSVTASQIACPGDCTGTYTHGTVVALTAVESVAGYTFAGWTNAPGCTTALNCNVTMTAARTVTATFTLNSYNLDVTVAGSGTVKEGTNINCPGDCVGTYTHGTTVPLTATAGSGWQFTGWTNACTGTGACSVLMNAAKTVTATFTQLFKLTVTIAGSTGTVTATGINCGADCTEDYLNGTLVDLTATGTGGATFAGWTGAPGCTTATTCTVTMNQVRNVTATFNPPVVLLTAATNGNGFGTVTAGAFIDCGNASGAGSDCTEPLVQGTSVTLIASPKIDLASEASTFSGWSGCDTVLGNQCTVTMAGAKTVTATFALAPNVMFVTSSSQELLGAGWLRNADAICNNLAAASTKNILGAGPGQNEKYIAWISGIDPQTGTTVTAAGRLAGITGWVRVDGRPVFDKITDIATHDLVYPPRFDENGVDVGAAQLVWTGTAPSGAQNDTSCIGAVNGITSSWVNTQATSTLGLASANSAQFTQFTAAGSCVGTRRLYCMGADRKASITATRSRGRLAFTTAGTFVPQAGGLDAADALCQSEASTAGLPNAGAFHALLSTTTTPALSRFQVLASDEPWIRVGDGQPLTPRESDMRDSQLATLTVAPNVTAMKTRLGNVEIWTGAPRPTAVSPNTAASCDDWKDPQVTKSSGGFAFDTGIVQIWFGGNPNTLACNVGRRLVCLEN